MSSDAARFRAVIDRAAGIAGVDFTEYLKIHRPYLTAGEVRQLAADGFTIGGHGWRHTPLGSSAAGALGEEIVSSCREMAKLSGQDRLRFTLKTADAAQRVQRIREILKALSP